MNSIKIEIKAEREIIDLTDDSESDVNDIIKLEYEEEINEKRYKCDNCEFASANFDDYQDHNNTCSSEVNEINPESSSSRENTEKTFLPKLNFELIYNCDRCDFTSENFCDYQAHDNACFCDFKDTEPAKKRNKPIGNKLCEICNKYFSATHLKKHIDRMHINPRPLDCQICGKIFQTSQEAAKHLYIHNEHKIHQCLICDEVFATRIALKTHNRAHKKQFKCDVCWMEFKREEELAKHSIIHISGIKFVCDICNLQFTTPYYLSIHKRLHTGEGLHECTICNLAFPIASLLSRHCESRKHAKKAALIKLQSLQKLENVEVL